MKGICFKELLLLKVVAGEKTQTRRIIKMHSPWAKEITETATPNLIMARFEPRYHPGDILYLKEPFAFERCHSEIPNRLAFKVVYAYDETPIARSVNHWANKLFMPEKHARYFIQITDVTAERAWSITEEDAIAEGCKDRAEFETLWMKINGISSWKDNPWVWKYTFERVATSEYWSKDYPYKILDPDGWDRSNWEFSWHQEKISLNEFENRVFKSTVIHKSSN